MERKSSSYSITYLPRKVAVPVVGVAVEQPCVEPVKRSGEACTQTPSTTKRQKKVGNHITYSAKASQISSSPLCVELVCHSDKEVRQHTGVDSYSLFKIIHDYLVKPCTEEECPIECHHQQHPSKKFICLTTENQMFLTLYKLRQNHSETQIAKSFGISPGSVSQIFHEWIKLMYRKFKIINIGAPLEQLRECMPKEVRDTFPSTREIYDATEIPNQRPSDPVAQKMLWSNYKHGHTIKVQIGCDASGTITSISDTYGGAISDKKLFINSGVVDRLKEGEAIMVDKGYLIHDVLQGKGVQLLRPPFLRKGAQFTPQEAEEGRKIARHRGVIENVNSKLKQFKILSHKVPIPLDTLINEIVYVCGFLTSFDPPLRKDKE